MKEKFKRQHIVPQAYLNRFAVLSGDRYIIGTRLSSEKGVKIFTRSVADVAYIENYYDTCIKKDKKYYVYDASGKKISDLAYKKVRLERNTLEGYLKGEKWVEIL